LARNLVSLTDLDITSMTYDTEDAVFDEVVGALSSLNCLRVLKAGNRPWASSDYLITQALASLRSLAHLDLSHSMLSDRHTLQLTQLSTLSHLGLSANHLLTNECVHNLIRITTLSSMDIRGCPAIHRESVNLLKETPLRKTIVLHQGNSTCHMTRRTLDQALE
jgi:hypothetical protein